MHVKHLIRRTLNKFGFDITRTGVMGTRKTLDQAYAHVVRFGFKPQTIIDIGVAGGTPELYRNFPDVFLLLIEPLPLFTPDLESILYEHRGEYVLAAACSYSGTIEFNVHDDQPEGSSIFKETMSDFADGHSIKAAAVTVDDIVSQKKLEGPFLIKIDVQGAEIEAIMAS